MQRSFPSRDGGDAEAPWGCVRYSETDHADQPQGTRQETVGNIWNGGGRTQKENGGAQQEGDEVTQQNVQRQEWTGQVGGRKSCSGTL